MSKYVKSSPVLSALILIATLAVWMQPRPQQAVGQWGGGTPTDEPTEAEADAWADVTSITFPYGCFGYATGRNCYGMPLEPPSEGTDGNSGGEGGGLGSGPLGPIQAYGAGGEGCVGCGDVGSGVTVLPAYPPSGDRPGVNYDSFTRGNSLIDNYTFTYIHWAWDYRVPSSAPGFGTVWTTFRLQRFYRSRNMTEPGASGRGSSRRTTSR